MSHTSFLDVIGYKYRYVEQFNFCGSDVLWLKKYDWPDNGVGNKVDGNAEYSSSGKWSESLDAVASCIGELRKIYS